MADSCKTITILVVDDEKLIRSLLGDTLGALGYSTITVEDYNSAVKVLEKQEVDVVITDILLPDQLGYDLIKLVKSEYPGIPILAISGKPISKKDVIEAGADGFLSKPFRIGVVEDLIQTTLLRYDIRGAKSLPKRKRILVVDDEPDVISTLIESLEVLGYSADGAGNGIEALEALAKKPFDLVITDIRMPQKNGIDLLKDIKVAYPATPVVIITGYPLAYPPDQAICEGADGYIAKPFRINQIDELLAKLLYNFKVEQKS
jgi:CheY-like chemotaxis protein